MSGHTIVPAGETGNPEPGDFILVHRKGLVSSVIRWGERLRFRSGARWSHAAFCESEDLLIEALTRGVVRTPLAAYHDVEYVIVHTCLYTYLDSWQARAYACSCLGQRYGWGTILSVALQLLTPRWAPTFATSASKICSGLVASALVRGWPIYPVEPMMMTPAGLAEFHGAPDRPSHD